MRCCVNIVNSIVVEGLKDMCHSIACIPNAVRFVNSSHVRFQKFRACVEHEKAFDRLEEEDGNYVSYFLEDISEKTEQRSPKCDDWKKVCLFVKFLKIFHYATLKLNASLPFNSNLYFHEMCEIQTDLAILSRNQETTMASNMKKIFDKYWGSIDKIIKLLIISVVLDPHYKLQYVSFCFRDRNDNERAQEMKKEIKDLLLRLYGFYSALENYNSNGAQSLSAEKLSTEVGMIKEKYEGDEHVSHRCKFRKLVESQDWTETSNEIDRYLLEPIEFADDDKFDILLWWKMNYLKYQILSDIAKDMFAIPISTMSSESIFNTERQVLDSFRSSLSPKMLEALICSQNWLQSCCFPTNNDVSIFEEMEFYESLESECAGLTSTTEMAID
ncbi:hypothetical protein Dsin_015796 [Dipteronia sinensis]|uniref:Zinc finger BED domain-containing protein RICESLEEPER 2-like n=1 Tax=Dipteronia sinensis TaxID=43782 RepID=A0AAE0AD85_9ROSI|nr:hypothetical protein Dsin_015796 [Dipteronia sinensis]